MRKFENSLIGRPNTIKTQKSLFKKHIYPHVYGRSDKAIASPNFIRDLQGNWSYKGLSVNTMKSLKCLLEKYILWKTGEKVITGKTWYLGFVEMKLKFWTKEQCQRVLDFAKSEDPSFYELIVVALHTGMRKGEIFGLKYSDINWDMRHILVQRSFNGPTKTGKPRVIPMSDLVFDVLFDKAMRLTVDRDWRLSKCRSPSPSLASVKCFMPYEPCARLRKICEQADVPYITFHGLRHTFATLALESGKSPKLVSGVLGHAKVSTTLDTYWQFTGDKLELDFLP